MAKPSVLDTHFKPGKKINAQINHTSPILIVGEAPGGVEETLGYPFAGPSGALLEKALGEVGLSRSLCSVTNVVKYKPKGNEVATLITDRKKDVPEDWPEVLGLRVHPIVAEGVQELRQEIDILRPKLIIALGNTALWALTGMTGIMKWRGSMLSTDLNPEAHTVIPTYHPSAVLRQWSWRNIMVQDLRRAKDLIDGPVVKPEYKFQLFPKAREAIDCMTWLIDRATYEPEPVWLSIDIETIRHHLACAGIAWSETEAICIPIFTRSNYYDIEEELAIIMKFRELCKHPNIKIIGQNYLYDAQYFAKFWGVFRPADHDTMISNHSLFVELPKALDFLASMYCEHYIYWKDDLKDYKSAPTDDRKFFHYNCEDCCRTYEVAMGQMDAKRSMNLEQIHDFQQSMSRPVLRAMLRGVRVNKAHRKASDQRIEQEIITRQEYVNFVFGQEINIRSPKQMQQLFFEDFGVLPTKNRKTGNVSVDDESLDKIARREILLSPVIRRIREMRSLGIFLSTFLRAPLDTDERMRCSYNIAGTDTYRLSSSSNAFGSGTNLQNFSKGNEDDPDRGVDELMLPNLRRDLIPDPGYIMCDMDLDRADLQVVVAEADDEELRIVMVEGLDIHLANARAVFRLPFSLDDLRDPVFEKKAKKQFGKQRQLAKSFCHGTNYGGGARTMAITCGITVAESEAAQRAWFSAHPGIHDWHRRVEHALKHLGFIENKLGGRRYFFDRTDGLLPEALAWIPQSTVALYINHAWRNIDRNLPEVQILLQTHDSLTGQVPIHRKEELEPLILEQSRITIPYPKELVIPASAGWSLQSWGDC
jgi:DNA polymerase I-like protein with 3'-5' exonuclease and polymerase domains/uracil-DNA glycosylase